MVKFEKDKFIIEVYVGCASGESWSGLLLQLITLLKNQDPKSIYVDFGEIYNLLNAMLPSGEQAIYLSQLGREPR